MPSDTEEKANYNLSLSELLEKYAVEDSDNDPDFVPNLEDLERDSSSESMGSSENEDEDTSDLTKVILNTPAIVSLKSINIY